MIYLFMKEFSAIMIMYRCYFYPSIFMTVVGVMLPFQHLKMEFSRDL